MIDATHKSFLQESEYSFPYHFIPSFTKDGIPVRSRFLGWGMEYLCYNLQAIKFVLDVTPQSLLDVGCGDGRFLSLVGDQVEKKVGCDLSSRAISFAKAMNPDVDYRCVDVHQIDEAFDVVTAIEVLEHIPDSNLEHFVAKLFDRVKKNGILIICVPSTCMRLSPKHYRHYDEKLLDQHISLPRVTYEKVDSVRIFPGRDLVYNLYLRLTSNAIYNLEAYALNKVVWEWIWNRRFSPKKGLHVISIYKKV